MGRRWGLVAVVALLATACPAGNDPYTAMDYRRDAVARAEAGKQYRLRIQAEQQSRSLAELDAVLGALRLPKASVPKRAARTAPRRGCAGQRSLEQIARDESGGRYDAQNPRSSASGKYQVLDGTWDGYGGYARAKDAPPEVQERWAREAYAKAGSRPWRASGC